MESKQHAQEGHRWGWTVFTHCCWAGRRAIWLTSRGWGDYAHTCYIIIVVEAVFVQVTRFLLNSIRAGSSFISGLSDGISWPLPEAALTARLTKKKAAPQKGEWILSHTRADILGRAPEQEGDCWGRWLTWTIPLQLGFIIYEIKVLDEFPMSHPTVRCSRVCVSDTQL